MASSVNGNGRAVAARTSYEQRDQEGPIKNTPKAVLTKCFTYLTTHEVALSASRVSRDWAACLPMWATLLRCITVDEREIRGLWALFHRGGIQPKLPAPLFPNVTRLNANCESNISEPEGLQHLTQTYHNLSLQCPKVTHCALRRYNDSNVICTASLFQQRLESLEFHNDFVLKGRLAEVLFPNTSRIHVGNHRNLLAVMDNKHLRELVCGTPELPVSSNSISAIGDRCEDGRIKLRKLHLTNVMLGATQLVDLARCKDLEFLSIQITENSHYEHFDLIVEALLNLIDALPKLRHLAIHRCPAANLPSLEELRGKVKREMRLEFS